MAIKVPNLDDRDFDQMVEVSLRRVKENCPQWTDLSPHDPGVVLLELFAFLTESMIYRLNRLPEKAYIEFLRLIGLRLSPPVAAVVKLEFKLNKVQDKDLEIPRGTRVTFSRTDASNQPPVFITAQTTVVPKGETLADAVAYNCEFVEAELIGKGTGAAGLSLKIKRAPIVALTGTDLEILVGVEATQDELKERPRAVEYQGKTFRIWKEVENFTDLDDKFAYTVDRVMGTITFAPAVQLEGADGTLSISPAILGEKPPEGREIRVWYASGGGRKAMLLPIH